MSEPKSIEQRLYKEASDPKADGFMRVEEVVEALASGYTARYEDNSNTLEVTKIAGRVRSDTLDRLMREGWLKSFANGGGFWLSDKGQRSYLRSTDELGDGKLVPPVLLQDEPRCPKCGVMLGPTIMGQMICRGCGP
jgi:hypothetical protein